MALARTDLDLYNFDNGAGFTAQGSGAFTTATLSPTPANGSLLLAAVYGGPLDAGGGDDVGVLTDSLGLSWTKIVKTEFNWVDTDYVLTQLWYAIVDEDASGGMTLTYTHTGRSFYQMGIWAAYYTGYDTGSPIGAKSPTDSTSTSSTPGLTLDATPAATSNVYAMIAMAGTETTTETAGSSFTEIDAAYTTNAFLRTQIQARTGSTSTAVSWSTANVAAAPYNVQAMVAAEIKEAAGGGVSIPVMHHHYATMKRARAPRQEAWIGWDRRRSGLIMPRPTLLLPKAA